MSIHYGTVPAMIYFWLCLGGLLLYYIYSRRKLYWLSWQLPGPNPALPFIGNLPMLLGIPITDVIKFFDQKSNELKWGIGRVWVGPMLIVIVKDPKIAYQINQKTLHKSSDYKYMMGSVFSRGLLVTNDIPYYRKNKKAFLAALSTDHLKAFVSSFHNESLRTMDNFQNYVDRGESLHTSMLFAEYAMTCTIKCILDWNLDSINSELDIANVIRAFNQIFECFQDRMFVPMFRSNLIYNLLGNGYKESETIQTLVAFCKEIVLHHKEKNNNYEQMVKAKSSFIDYLHELHLSEDEVSAQILSMVEGASDTLHTELTALVILLAQNSQVQGEVYKEVIQVLGSDLNVCPSMEDLNKLEYLDRVLKEALRMFPSVPWIAKSVPEDFKISTSAGQEHVIPVGVTVLISIRNIMNDPQYYENPAVFDPDRWLPGNVAKRPPYSFLPFSNGPRTCPGGRYALLQMKTMVATLVRAFEIQPTESCARFEDIRCRMRMIMHIDNSCHVRLKKR